MDIGIDGTIFVSESLAVTEIKRRNTIGGVNFWDTGEAVGTHQQPNKLTLRRSQCRDLFKAIDLGAVLIQISIDIQVTLVSQSCSTSCVFV